MAVCYPAHEEDRWLQTLRRVDACFPGPAVPASRVLRSGVVDGADRDSDGVGLVFGEDYEHVEESMDPEDAHTLEAEHIVSDTSDTDEALYDDSAETPNRIDFLAFVPPSRSLDNSTNGNLIMEWYPTSQPSDIGGQPVEPDHLHPDHVPPTRSALPEQFIRAGPVARKAFLERALTARFAAANPTPRVLNRNDGRVIQPPSISVTVTAQRRVAHGRRSLCDVECACMLVEGEVLLVVACVTRRSPDVSYRSQAVLQVLVLQYPKREGMEPAFAAVRLALVRRLVNMECVLTPSTVDALLSRHMKNTLLNELDRLVAVMVDGGEFEAEMTDDDEWVDAFPDPLVLLCDESEAADTPPSFLLDECWSSVVIGWPGGTSPLVLCTEPSALDLEQRRHLFTRTPTTLKALSNLDHPCHAATRIAEWYGLLAADQNEVQQRSVCLCAFLCEGVSQRFVLRLSVKWWKTMTPYAGRGLYNMSNEIFVMDIVRAMGGDSEFGLYRSAMVRKPDHSPPFVSMEAMAADLWLAHLELPKALVTPILYGLPGVILRQRYDVEWNNMEERRSKLMDNMGILLTPKWMPAEPGRFGCVVSGKEGYFEKNLDVWWYSHGVACHTFLLVRCGSDSGALICAAQLRVPGHGGIKHDNARLCASLIPVLLQHRDSWKIEKMDSILRRICKHLWGGQRWETLDFIDCLGIRNPNTHLFNLGILNIQAALRARFRGWEVVQLYGDELYGDETLSQIDILKLFADQSPEYVSRSSMHDNTQCSLLMQQHNHNLPIDPSISLVPWGGDRGTRRRTSSGLALYRLIHGGHALTLLVRVECWERPGVADSSVPGHMLWVHRLSVCHLNMAIAGGPG